MDNVAHVLDGHDLEFILIFVVLKLWLIQLKINCLQLFWATVSML